LFFALMLAAVFASVSHAASGTPAPAVKQLDVSRFNRIYEEPKQEARPQFSLFAPETWTESGALDFAKKHGKALSIIVVVFIILAGLQIPRMIRPELKGLGPFDVLKKLKGYSVGRWELAEINAFAAACAKLNRLSVQLAAKMDEQQSEDFLGALYTAGSYTLFVEALFLRKDVFARLPDDLNVEYGACGVNCVKRMPVKSMSVIIGDLREVGSGTLSFQAANSLAQVLMVGGMKEKAVELLRAIPPAKMHKSTWELFLDVCGAVHSLPAEAVEAIPAQLRSRVVMALIDEGHSAAARRLLDRQPREQWHVEDHLAYFALQLETDLAMANDFYAVFVRSVDLRAHPDVHYAAAQRCEKKGHTDMAITIYRRFISEGINYHNVSARYDSLKKSLAIAARNCAIMFTDIKDYTSRSSSEPAAFMMEYLKKHDDMVVPQIQAFKGKIVKKMGDAFLAVFESSTNAVLCGAAIQKVLSAYNIGKDERDAIHVRVALHAGEVSVAADGDIYGDAVNIAARLEGVAHADEIWFTDAVCLTMNKSDVKYTQVGYQNFKGIEKPVMVYRVAAQKAESGTPA